jgi:hypothetical protein
MMSDGYGIRLMLRDPGTTWDKALTSIRRHVPPSSDCRTREVVPGRELSVEGDIGSPSNSGAPAPDAW